MDPASSKLLLWLLSFTRDRESSSSGNESGKRMRKEKYQASCQIKQFV